MLPKCLLRVVLASALLTCAFGQSAPAPSAGSQAGSQPYVAYQGGDIDAVDLYNGQLAVNVPFLSYPQRGKLKVSFSLQYSNIQQHNTEICVNGVCSATWGNPFIPPFAVGPSAGLVWDQQVTVSDQPSITYLNQGKTDQITEYYSDWSLYTTGGTAHPLGNLGAYSWYTDPNTHYQYQLGSGPWRTLDATGWLVNGALNAAGGTGASGPNTPTSVIDPEGIVYSGFSPSSLTSTQMQDPNGNLVTSNATTITDTVGRQIPFPSSTSGASTSNCPVVGGISATSAALWTPPSYDGGDVPYTLCYATIAASYIDTSWTALQSVVLPTGQSWQFQYNDTVGSITYGTLSQITMPTGGTIAYTYLTTNGTTPCQIGGRWVASRTVNANDGTGPHTWTYTYNGNGYNGGSTVVTDPLGNDVVHTFGLGQCSGYETEAQYYQGSHTSGTLVKTVNTAYSDTALGYMPDINVVPSSVSTQWQDGQTSKVTYSYDSGFTFAQINTQAATGLYGRKISTSSYDYSGSVLKTVSTIYVWQSPSPHYSSYLANNLITLPYSITTVDGGGTTRESSYYGYDESALLSSGITEQKTTGESYPGNLTSVHDWLNGSTTGTTNCNVSVSSGYLVSQSVFYDTGELQQSSDPCSHSTSYTYSSTYYGALPTTVTNALSQSATYAYDPNTGVVTSATDANSQTTAEGYDTVGRLASITYPDGGSTTYCYTDMGGASCSQAAAPFKVVQTKKITSSLNETSTIVFDGLGRVSQTQLNSDPSGATYTLTTYDALGRKSQVYNPTRCSSITSNCQSETTWGYTTTGYDALSRVTSVTEPDGSIVTKTYDQINSKSSGRCTTVTDEAGKSRQTCADGLGRMTGVWEDPAGLNYETDYTYDALNNLLAVTQNGSNSTYARTRSFTYDSLSNLLSASNPESGNIAYAYDADGNVVTKTAPLPNQTGTSTVTTTYSYDALNRLVKKSYADGGTSDPYTSTVQFGYDGAALTGCTIAPPGEADTYPIGRRTSMCDGSGAANWTHNTMGRILSERRTIGGVIGKYDNDAYNLDGSVQSITVPAGYQIGYTYNAAGRQVAVKNYQDPATFVTGATYTPNGALAGMQLGTAPITVTNAYNDRLQPLLLSAANNSGATLFSECFDFHLKIAVNTAPCSFSASTGDNGNVYTIANNRDNTRSQNFMYDSLNRIQQAYSSGSEWGETFGPVATAPGVAPSTSGIDAWGNMTNRSGVTGKGNAELFSFAALTNNQLSGFGYDAAGNMINNTPTTYVYDAENRLIATGGISYIYDGDGNRVEKCTEGATPGKCASGATGTLYWWGTGNAPQAETDLAGNVLEDYIFLNGQRIARRDTATKVIHYYFSDHLGSHGVIEDATGTTCEQDIDYYPYGGVENDYCAGSGVTQNYKFTGKERDSESGLDNFGARYFTSSFGRFMTPDWAAKPTTVPYAKFGDPQSLNLYSYVENGPVDRIDPDGHLLCGNGCSQAENADSQDDSVGPTLYGNPGRPKDPINTPAQQQQAGNKVVLPTTVITVTAAPDAVNTVYNETGGLRPDRLADPNSARHLQAARENVAHVYKNTKGKGFQASKKLSARERAALRHNEPDAVNGYASSRDAVNAAYASDTDPTGGATHIYLFDLSPNSTQNVPQWVTNGNPTSAEGPFINAAGGGDVAVGAPVLVLTIKDSQ